MGLIMLNESLCITGQYVNICHPLDCDRFYDVFIIINEGNGMLETDELLEIQMKAEPLILESFNGRMSKRRVKQLLENALSELSCISFGCQIIIKSWNNMRRKEE